MFAEIAKPLALISCILSLYGLFYAAFLEPAVDWEQRVLRSLSLLLIAAGICVVSGLIFRETAPGRSANERHARPIPAFLVFAKPLHLLSRCPLLKQLSGMGKRLRENVSRAPPA